MLPNSVTAPRTFGSASCLMRTHEGNRWPLKHLTSLLSPMWETQIEFQGPEFHLAQPWLLQATVFYRSSQMKIVNCFLKLQAQDRFNAMRANTWEKGMVGPSPCTGYLLASLFDDNSGPLLRSSLMMTKTFWFQNLYLQRQLFEMCELLHPSLGFLFQIYFTFI